MSNQAANRREQLRRQQEAAAKAKRTQRIVGIVAAVVATVLVGILVFTLVNAAGNSARGSQTTPPNATSERTGIRIPPASGQLKEGAPTVEVFFDYQCPYCRDLETTKGAAFNALAESGEIALINRTMTFMDNNMRNTASSRAAVAAACSDEAGVYPEYNAAVFANQAAQEIPGSIGYTDELLTSTIPQAVGITGEALTRFQSCVSSNATKDFVDEVDKAAYKAGVTGTPTLHVNGKVVEWRPLPTTPEALLAALKAAA
ncbi:MAG: thioredoxin domain-containing protein [Propioniciclava sp.]|uniref:DsbA family protein n=1 Tax=Propioniciclava sp. TaxID=2038686 RepID=UPI0039E234E6